MTKILKFAVVLTLFLSQSVCAFGQEIYVKSPLRQLPTDLTASKYERKDAKGNSCAVIRVQLPSVSNISFNNNVGDVEQITGEYIVYVSPGINALNVYKDDKLACSIDMGGIEILPKNTYQVTLALMREQIFRIIPENAEVVVDGEKVALDNTTGIGRMNCEEDKLYHYTISASGYEPISGQFMISPEDVTIETISKTLDRQMREVKITCNAKNIEVYVGNEHIEKENGVYKIPLGYQEMRVTADKYNDWVHKYNITMGSDPMDINVSLTKSNDVSNKLRTRPEGYIFGGVTVPNGSSHSEMKSDNRVFTGIGLGADMFLLRWITFRPGVEVGYYPKVEKDDEEPIPYAISISVPLVLSFNVPLGKYNRHFFSIGAGPIIGGIFQKEDSKTDDNEQSIDASKNLDNSKTEFSQDFLYGLRISAQFTFSKFIMGVNLDYQGYSHKRVFAKNTITPMFTIGYKP